MKVKTREASGRVLDYLAAIAEGRALRKPVRGTNAEAAHKQVPFTMFEVVETHHPDGKVSHHVEEITVTRFGISPGCSAPSISFTRIQRNKVCAWPSPGCSVPSISFTIGRQRALGSVSLFYFDRAEADLECYGNTHGWLDGFTPSTNRDQGYEIFDRERIGFKYTGTAMGFVAWLNGELSTKYDHYGKDPLEAGLRVYVHKKLGGEVDIPDELTELGETK